MATHSGILAWRIPGTEKTGGLQFMGSQSQTRLKQLTVHASLSILDWIAFSCFFVWWIIFNYVLDIVGYCGYYVVETLGSVMFLWRVLDFACFSRHWTWALTANSVSWWLRPRFSSLIISWCLSFIWDSAIRQNLKRGLNAQNTASPSLALSRPELPTHLLVTVPNSTLCSLSQKDCCFLLSTQPF